MSLTSNRELIYNERIRKASEGYVNELSEKFLHSSSSPEELRLEVKKMSAKKAQELFGSEEDRKVWIESIRSSVEQSLQNQVRAVLGTPPEVKRKQQRDTNKKREGTRNSSFNSTTLKQSTGSSKERSYIFLKESNQCFKFHKELLNDLENCTHSPTTTACVDPLSDDFNKIFSPYTRAALENINVGSSSYGNTRKTFQQPYQRAPGTVWRDAQGTEHELAGPFWPKDHLPLYTNQKHIEYVPTSPEPLNSTGTQGVVKEDNLSLFPKSWKGSAIVYDRNNVKLCSTAPPGCLPNLKFESRFECGNLQQAKRVGRCEYTLILTTDLYTKRHTQWYYFQVGNMAPGITYKFNIVNLLKRDSLYNYGMKPLLYSQKLAANENIGWKRTGHSIYYARNMSPKTNPLLAKELVYYALSFQMEFPHNNDVCYLAHCYPYSYSDLDLYLRTLVDSPSTSQYVRKEALCKTLAGNNCHILTITSSKVPDNKKLGVVISARVHPGETNASWMMKGVMDYLTSNDPVAESLRQKFVFKIVPMLNPDGVIVGNYRTNLAAKDLNRTFKEPHKNSFPTVWHTKSMLESFKENHQVIIYCDLHGHSRKPNVFMYGCTADPRMGSVSNFLEERLFPWMMSQKAPDKFSFQGCKFIVRKCKESTARVVMWRQLGIMNSFTMEATFCGANFGDMEKGRHFNTHDFEDMGRHFCEVLMEYSEAKSANRNEMTQAFVELACKMTRDILRQSLGSYKKLDSFNNHLTTKPYENKSNAKTTTSGQEKPQIISCDRKALTFSPVVKDVNFVDVNVQRSSNSDANKNGNDYEIAVKSIHVDSFNDCIKILEGLGLTNCYEESDSSDSDSEPEVEFGITKKNSTEAKKRKKKKKKKQNWWETLSKTTQVEVNKDKNSEEEQAKAEEKKVKTSFGKYVNPYANRSNNGIPVYSQERIQERARKKEMEKEEKDRNQEKQQPNGDVSSGSDSFIVFTDNTELNFVTAQRRLTYCMMNRHKPSTYVRSVSHPNMTVLPSHATDIESFKMDHLNGGGYGFSVRFPAKKERETIEKQESFREMQKDTRSTSLQSFEEARSINGSPSFVEIDPYDTAPLMDAPTERRSRYATKSTERNKDIFPHDSYRENDNSTAKDLETMMRLVNQNSSSFDSDLLSEFNKWNIRGRHRQKRVVRSKSRNEHELSVNNRSTVELRTPLFLSCSADRVAEDNNYWLSQHDDESPKFEPTVSIPSYSSISYSSPTTRRRNYKY